VLHLSVPDGWWHEAFCDGNGWAIGDDTIKSNSEEEDKSDGEALYDLLEEEVIPLYYTRDRNSLPQGWVAKMKKSMRTIIPVYSAARMLKEYCERMYLPASKA